MKRVCGMRNVVLIFVVFVALVSCVAGKKAEGPGSYAIEQEVPQVIAVLPASMEAAQAATDKGEIDPEDAEFVCGLTRNVLHNHLAGKGVPAHPDECGGPQAARPSRMESPGA